MQLPEVNKKELYSVLFNIYKIKAYGVKRC